jgi:methylated-DNA-[protein]-cysteine S-methyltransferase
MKVAVYEGIIASPWGPICLGGIDEGLTHVHFQHDAHPLDAQASGRTPPGYFDQAIQQLREYFEGTRRTFNLPLAPPGTAFQQRVWQALQHIPYGHTITYQDLAVRLGQPTASRAVGSANGRNPIAIIVPCHRVIGRDGRLRGYAGGLHIKQQLLQHEGAWPQSSDAADQ